MNPNQICFQCNNEMKLVPAGVSRKTGKSYSAFWACENKCLRPYPPRPVVNNNPVPAPIRPALGQTDAILRQLTLISEAVGIGNREIMKRLDELANSRQSAELDASAELPNATSPADEEIDSGNLPF